jgi:hypothetical protein
MLKRLLFTMFTGISVIVLYVLTGCDVNRTPANDGQKTIRIAELHGQRAGAEKELELQRDELNALESRIRSARPNSRTPDGFRILGPNPDWFRQRDRIRERLIALQSELARVTAP